MPNPPGGSQEIPDQTLGPFFLYSTLINVTRLCPHTFDPHAPSVTLATLKATCTLRVPRTKYYAFQFGPPPGLVRNDYHGDGATFFVPPDEGHVQIIPMDGFELVAAACATVPPRAQTTIVPFNDPPFDDVITIETKLFKITYCTWYLYLPEATAEVMVHTWQCPPGYDLTAPTADPAADCTTPIDGVRTVIYVDILSDLSYYGDTGDDGPGAVHLYAIPPNTYELFILPSTLPAEGGTLAASCDGAPLTIDYKLLPTIGPGASLDCHWYWAPAP